MQTQQIGFIGLGNMGGRMTRRLVDAGHDVLGFDPRVEQVAAAGAVAAGTVRAVIESTEVILLSLPDSSVVERVARGDDGILASCRAGQVVIDLSTASPRSTVAIHQALGEHGVDYVDAGISGGAAAAEAGTLTVMVGASPGVLDGVRWVFEPFASNVVDMGGPGAGHTTKVLNNFLNAVSLAATAEVMVAAKKAGLDLDTLLDVLNTSSGVNFATQKRFPHIVHGDYLEGGLTSALMTKDIALYVDQLHALGVPSLNAVGPLATFGLANSLGYADQISNRVVDAVGDVSGGVRLHTDSPAPGGSR